MDIFEEAREIEDLYYISDLRYLSETEKDSLIKKMKEKYDDNPDFSDFVSYLKGGKR